MIVTIVTPVFNCAEFITECIASVKEQNYPHIEHLIVDGKSSDRTISLIAENMNSRIFLVSEPDLGIYDAINKGISIAKGDVLGILNADDRLASESVISSIVYNFKKASCDAVYGNLLYVKRWDISKISRRWLPGSYFSGRLNSGWMVPHPTLYLRRELYSRIGLYSLDFGTSGDYEFILRLFRCHDLRATYLNLVITIMRDGGVSNGSIKKMLGVLISDFKVLKKSHLKMPLLVLANKKFGKLKDRKSVV